MDPRLWQNGPIPGQFYDFPGCRPNPVNYHDSSKRTLQPATTGTSVLGVKFAGGVLIAADMLGSYGSLARFRNISRVMKVNEQTILGCGGDYADYQHIKKVIEQAVIDEECLNDGFSYTPKALYNWLTRVMYNRRSQFNPLWNVTIVGGMENGVPFLGYVDKLGVAYETDTAATGYGAYIAQPLMRDAYEKKDGKLTEKEATDLLDRCMKVLYYRDARAFNRYEVAIVTPGGARIASGLSVKADWSIANLVSGYE